MAKIVLGIGTSHSPMLNTPPDIWPQHVDRDYANSQLWARDGKPHNYEDLLALTDPSIAKEITPEKWQQRYDACQQAIAKLGEIVAAANPDVIVAIGDDQKELLVEENMPAMLVYWGETVPNIPRHSDRMPPSIRAAQWGNEFDEPRDLPGSHDLGLHIIETAMDNEFDVAHSKRLPEGHGIGHAFGFVQRRILNGKPVPIVPIMLNTYYPPNQPTPKRSYDFGRMLKQAIESWDSDARVAVLASGGLSHFVIDEELDRAALKAMKENDFDHLKSIPTSLLNSGNSEIRNWIATAATLTDLDMKMVDYVPCYRSPAGTGCAMGFVYWN